MTANIVIVMKNITPMINVIVIIVDASVFDKIITSFLGISAFCFDLLLVIKLWQNKGIHPMTKVTGFLPNLYQ